MIGHTRVSAFRVRLHGLGYVGALFNATRPPVSATGLQHDSACGAASARAAAAAAVANHGAAEPQLLWVPQSATLASLPLPLQAERAACCVCCRRTRCCC